MFSKKGAILTIHVPSSVSGSTSLSLLMLTWSGLLARDLTSSLTDLFWSAEVIEESEPNALSKARVDFSGADGFLALRAAVRNWDETYFVTQK